MLENTNAYKCEQAVLERFLCEMFLDLLFRYLGSWQVGSWLNYLCAQEYEAFCRLVPVAYQFQRLFFFQLSKSHSFGLIYCYVLFIVHKRDL